MEKAMSVLFVEPKLYAYGIIDENGNVDLESTDSIVKKGLYSNKRGNPRYINYIFDNLLLIILKYENIVTAFNFITDSIVKLMENKIEYTDLQMIRGVSGVYKSETYFMNVFCNQMKRIGKPIVSGSRVEYIVCKNKDSDLLGERMKLIEQYLEGGYEVDINYYLENIAMNPIDKIFATGYNKILPLMKEIGYKPNSRKHFVPVSQPVKMIARMIEDKVDLSIVKLWFKSQYDIIIRPKDPIKIEQINEEQQRIKIKVKINNEAEKNIESFTDNKGNVINKVVL
jgi:DNA polymerase elongation subunit (family B)